MIISGREFDVNDHTYIFGILNVTQDSFSDGGKYCNLEAALKRADEMIAEGVDIIDVGGESTRPGFTPISAHMEIEAVVPVIEAIKKKYDVIVSLDTRKAEVARAGIKAGVDIINDVDGLKGDPEMASVIAKSGCSCVIMHNRENNNYVNLIDDIIKDLKGSLYIAECAGIERDKIIIDPGSGVAKDTAQNLEVLRNLDRFNELKLPIMLAHSRKSVIGNTLKLPVDQRLEGTLALTALAVMHRYAFVRVHDIQENRRVIEMLEAVYGRDKS